MWRRTGEGDQRESVCVCMCMSAGIFVYGISYGFVLSQSNFQGRINQLTYREFLKALHVVLCYEIRIILV